MKRVYYLGLFEQILKKSVIKEWISPESDLSVIKELHMAGLVHRSKRLLLLQIETLKYFIEGKTMLINKVLKECSVCRQRQMSNVTTKNTEHRPWERPRKYFVTDTTKLPISLQTDEYSLLLNMVDAGSKYAYSFLVNVKTPRRLADAWLYGASMKLWLKFYLVITAPSLKTQKFKPFARQRALHRNSQDLTHQGMRV